MPRTDVTCDPQTFYHFVDNRSLIVVLGISAFIATTSAICALCLLGNVLYRWNRHGWKRHFRPLEVTFAFWIFMDVIQSSSRALTFRWAVSGAVDHGGGYCMAQGVLEQFGDAGTALAAFLVAVLVVSYYRRVTMIVDHPRAVSWVLILFFAMALVSLIILPTTMIRNFYGNVGLWCWILHGGASRNTLQIASCYALMLLGALASVVGYGYVFIGTLNETNLARRDGGSADFLPMYTVEDAKRMMWYSLAYVIEVVPFVIIRLVTFYAKFPCPGVRAGWNVFAISLLGASGLINVLLWIITGRRFGFATEEERRRDVGPAHSDCSCRCHGCA
ncbi:uncharacterized protein EI90DRAFT_3160423 [Cantharellus anzutake]|uniref:uncharacterized protein n=1 Tax=Cantharellus anzutake TaxID=1750568 RepID=UPI0019057A93|nr:uncharacterized protein EI90DRAFT_3160423 [Cantharellus anzutake]KAF8311536.1 hypothetical protein EI90DRAFT_3160423 [Cantharellus anzutake]